MERGQRQLEESIRRQNSENAAKAAALARKEAERLKKMEARRFWLTFGAAAIAALAAVGSLLVQILEQ